METIKVEKPWQLAGVYYVRTEGMVKGFNIPLELEFSNDDASSQYMLVLDEGLPIATCRPKLIDAQTAKIERVCVLESCRGKNVGRKLIEDTEKWLKTLGIKKIIIDSREAVVEFYEKLGYIADRNQVKQGFFKEVHTEKIL